MAALRHRGDELCRDRRRHRATYTLVGADQGFSVRVGVTASNSVGSTVATSVQTAVVSAASTVDPTLVAAGDLCGSPTDCGPTANLIGSINPTVAITLGDNAYTTGSASDYAANYDPNWGKYKAITKPAPGNHEYDYGNQQTGYFAYFNNPPAYYSYDIGSWHLISLNGEISASAGSAQETWLKTDLAAHTNMCTLAYWHEPRWSSGYHGGSSYFGTFWTDLYNGGADLVLNGHDHDYERFAPQDPSGNLDTPKGIREFVVGTGGDSHYTFNAPTANSEVRDSTSFGVLKLTLHAGSYDWKFVPVAASVVHRFRQRQLPLMTRRARRRSQLARPSDGDRGGSHCRRDRCLRVGPFDPRLRLENRWGRRRRDKRRPHRRRSPSRLARRSHVSIS